MESAEDRARLARELLDFAASLTAELYAAATARTIAILPVKSFGAAKQRLADVLGDGARKALAQAMFGDVLATLRRVPGLDAIAVVTADRAAESAAAGERVTVLHDGAQSGQSDAALIGIRHALAAGYDRAVLVPGDTPLLQPREVTALLDGTGELVIVPDRHGTGTNALVLSPPDAIEPAFGPDSFARHTAAAQAASCRTASRRWPVWCSTWTRPATSPSSPRRSRNAVGRRP